MFRTFAAFAAAVLLATGLGTTSASAVGTCAIGGDSSFGVALFADGDLSTTSLCSGIYSAGISVVSGTVATIGSAPAPGSQQEVNEFNVNLLAFAGHTDWTLAEEVSDGVAPSNSTSNDNGFGLVLTETIGGGPLSTFYGKTGRWEVSSFGTDAVRAAIVMLSKADEWSIYLLSDLSLLSGAYDFSKNYTTGTDFKQDELQSFQLYISTDVPVPAALPMLLTGLVGFAVFKRRKRAA